MIPMLWTVAEAGTPAKTYITEAIAGVDFMVILNEIVAVAPTVLPVVVLLTGFRKALRWVIGSVKGA